MRKVIVETILLAIAVGLTVEVIKSAIPYLPLIWLTLLAHYTWEAASSKWVVVSASRLKGRFSRRAVMYSYVVVGIGAAGLGCLYWWGLNSFFAPRIAAYEAERQKQAEKAVPGIANKNLVLHDLFVNDFAHEDNTNSIGGGWTLLAKTGIQLHVEYRVIYKMDSNSKYVMFFVPYTQHIYNVVADLAVFYTRAFDEAGEFGIAGKGQVGDSSLNKTQDFAFTGRIFIYSQADLGIEELGKLTELYKKRGLRLQFRSNDYLEYQQLKRPGKQPTI